MDLTKFVHCPRCNKPIHPRDGVCPWCGADTQAE